MKKFIYIISILISCLTFWSCKKNSSANIEIKGRVINFWDKSPVPSQIQLWVGAATPGSKGTTNYGSYSTNADGSFDIKSNAQWDGDDYRLRVLPNVDPGSNFRDVSCTVGKNKTTDVGDIITGDFTFNCKVTLNSVSIASITFLEIGTTIPQVTSFSAGTNTVVTASKVYSYSEYQIFGNFYRIAYRLSTSSMDSSIKAFAPTNRYYQCYN